MGRAGGAVRLVAGNLRCRLQRFRAQFVGRESPPQDSLARRRIVCDRPLRCCALARSPDEQLEAAHYVVASACSRPASSFTRETYFNGYFGGGIPPFSYATGEASLVRAEPLPADMLVNDCEGLGCDPLCYELR